MTLVFVKAVCIAVSKSPSQMRVFPFRYKTASKNLANNASLESYGATDSAQDFDSREL